MLPVANEFDVYVSPAGGEANRKTTLLALYKLHRIDKVRQRAFYNGERILLRERLSDGEAQRMATGLRALGVRVDIEAHSRGMGLAELDSFTTDAPVGEVAAAPQNLLFDVGAGLVGLDGNEEDIAPPPAALSRAAPPPPPPPPRAAPPPPRPSPPKAAPLAAAGAEDRFRPVGADSNALNLALDVVPPDPMLSKPPARQDAFEVPRCPTHDVPKVGGRCPRCDGEDAAVRGRLFGGKLRDNPALRVGIGVAAGIVLGWIVTAPMSKKAARAVDYKRDEANRERARPTEEAQAHAKRLDEEADDDAQSAFFRTLGVWALIAGAATAGWYRLT